MGLYDHVHVEEGVPLPHFPNPEQIDPTEIGWQSKSISEPLMEHYKLTSDGSLFKKQQSYRDKTEEEKLLEAGKWGFDSWEAYLDAYDENENEESLLPDFAKDIDRDGKEYPPLFPDERTLDEEWWEDAEYHGSFEFYSSIRRDPQSTEEKNLPDGDTIELPDDYALNVFVCYEARFTDGTLDDIILVGRHNSEADDVIRQLNEWAENEQE